MLSALASRWLPLALIAASPLGVACGTAPPPPTDGAGGGDARTDASTDAPDTPDAPAPDAPATARAEIEPGAPEVVSVDGSRPTLALRVVRVDPGGAREPVAGAHFYLEHERFGGITPEGVFTANGIAGGAVEVFASVLLAGRPVELRTTLTVRVDREAIGPEVPTEVLERFDRTPPVRDAERAARVVYPLDLSLMPNNVAPPDVQWDGGEPGDAYRVRVTRGAAMVTAYLLHGGPSFTYRFAFDDRTWRTVAESAPGTPVQVAVDRWDAAAREVIAGEPVAFRLTHAALFADVYYVGVQPGPRYTHRVYRAPLESGAPATRLFDSRVDNSAEPIAVSRDGRRLVGSLTYASMDGTKLDESFVGLFDLTTDLRVYPPAPVARIAPLFARAAFAPDGTRLWLSGAQPEDVSAPTQPPNPAFTVLDASTLARVTVTGLPDNGGANPALSPDGARLAYVRGGYDDLYRGGGTPTELVVQPRTGPDAFGPAVTLHRGMDLASAPEGGVGDFNPTFAPDNRTVAFAHGSHPTGFFEIFDPERRSALYALDADAPAPTPVRLTRAMGREGGTAAYWPAFAPTETREPDGTRYHWLAFYSRAPYGNARAGSRGTNRRQIWVAAVRADAPAGADPSSAPFWLRGQASSAENHSAQWAPGACRADARDCTLSSQCCSGLCRPADASGERFTCQVPTSCRRFGQSCTSAGDCCGGLQCNAGVCSPLPPG